MEFIENDERDLAANLVDNLISGLTNAPTEMLEMVEGRNFDWFNEKIKEAEKARSRLAERLHMSRGIEGVMIEGNLCRAEGYLAALEEAMDATLGRYMLEKERASRE